MEKAENHLKLVHFVCKKYRIACCSRAIEYDDIFQIGCIGLIKAIKDHNKDEKCAFSTYATIKIRGEILHYFRSDRFLVSKSGPERLKGNFYHPTSMDKVIYEDDGERAILSDAIGTEERGYNNVELTHFIDRLGGIHQKLYELYKQDLSQIEVSKKIGLSQATISRRTKELIVKLRECLCG